MIREQTCFAVYQSERERINKIKNILLLSLWKGTK